MNTYNLRISKGEMTQLDKLCMKVNTCRVKHKKRTVMESKLLHELLGMALEEIRVTPEGELYLDLYEAI
jgi:hypothetical protein